MCGIGWYSDDGVPPCTRCESRDKCGADVGDRIDSIDKAAESGDKEAVTLGLIEILYSDIDLTDSDVGNLMDTLVDTQGILANTSGDVEELSVVVMETIEKIKDSETGSFDTSAPVIDVLESATKTLGEGKNITTISIVAQSIIPRKEEGSLKLAAPVSVPSEDLPIKLNLDLMQGERVNVAVMNESYKEILPKTGDEKTTIGSPIISIIFPDIADKSNTSFSIIFQQKNHTEYPGHKPERKCVYLNTTTNTWLSNGCTTQLNTDKTCTCTCTHTTSFAVLLSFTPIEDQQGQEIATYVMFVINTLFLAVTFLLIAPFEKLRKKEIIITQLHLILSLILGNISFVILSASSTVAVDDEGTPLLSLNAGCVTGVIISQYFFLSAFFWMGCIAWTFFNKIVRAVKTFGKTNKNYVRNCALFSWICPVIFPVASLLFSFIPNKASDYSMPYVGAKKENGTYCWVEDPWRYIGFLVPAYLILLFNCVCFGMVAKIIIASSKKAHSDDAGLFKSAKAMMVVAVSVGIPWIVVGLAVGPGATFMQYLFIIFMGLQGPLLFVALIVLQDETRANTKKLLKRYFSGKPAEGEKEKATNLYSPGPSKNTPETLETTGIFFEPGDRIYSNIQEETVLQDREGGTVQTVEGENIEQENIYDTIPGSDV